LEEKAAQGVSSQERNNDAELIGKARSGETAAYGQIVRRYQERLLRTVVKMTGRIDAAQDIVQDAFVRAWQALDSYDLKQPFYPWLSRIAINLTMNYFKKAKRETPLDDTYDTTPDPGLLQDEKLALEENRKRLNRAIAELPEQYRVAFVLRTIEELSYDEIAQRLNISVGTVDSRLFRARRMLLEKLGDLLDG
jgi:RNA polymerase sigma-70 factor (ECF subfamily)